MDQAPSSFFFCGAATQSLYVDASSGIAKSNNLLAYLFEYLCKLEGEQKASDLLCGVDISCAWRVQELCRLLQKHDTFELWSWMATNVRALCWDEQAKETTSASATAGVGLLPYQVHPCLHSVLNCSMTFDITALLCVLDFFGTNQGPVALSKKRRAPKGNNDAVDHRDAMNALAFLLNKLPNRCVVRDFLMVLKGACRDSRFVDGLLAVDDCWPQWRLRDCKDATEA